MRWLTCMAIAIQWVVGSAAPPVWPGQLEPGMRTYYFDMEPKRRAEFVRQARMIGLGDSRAKVIELLGPPDFDQVGGRHKEGVLTRALTYYVKRWKKDTVNTLHDQVLELFFDPQTDRLGALASSVAEVPSLNFPPGSREK